MSGSLKWMLYTSDNASTYAVLIDESNGEAGGFADVAGTGDPGAQIPRYLRMRYVNLQSTTTPARRKKLYIGTSDNALYVDGGAVTIDGEAFQVTSARGEKGRKAFGTDTGLTDGDAE